MGNGNCRERRGQGPSPEWQSPGVGIVEGQPWEILQASMVKVWHGVLVLFLSLDTIEGAQANVHWRPLPWG